MNAKAAIFACRFTGSIGIAASFLMAHLYGINGLLLSFFCSIFWFVLAGYIQRQSKKMPHKFE